MLKYRPYNHRYSSLDQRGLDQSLESSATMLYNLQGSVQAPQDQRSPSHSHRGRDSYRERERERERQPSRGSRQSVRLPQASYGADAHRQQDQGFQGTGYSVRPGTALSGHSDMIRLPTADSSAYNPRLASRQAQAQPDPLPDASEMLLSQPQIQGDPIVSPDPINPIPNDTDPGMGMESIGVPGGDRLVASGVDVLVVSDPNLGEIFE
ncbi:hypothetical protein KIPB_002465 [Kipferlia bialata]|uniref:Uncharacterized protein n=1 Tax=Kipferlia bialata TaxID=797122 RepID=A0A9K3CSI3_9EUKA|nr:hypothetical protein KIPB_002465 [Kipferlia bialata]|eukprot:g2465.t1